MAGYTPVTFSNSTFLQMFPEFTGRVTPQTGQVYFNAASQVIRNDGQGPNEDQTTQNNMMYWATAHIAELFAPKQPGGAIPGRDPAVTGQITNASEGSVSVGIKPTSNANEEWWAQTNYGRFVWLMTAPFRTFRYRPGPRRIINPWPFTTARRWPVF